MLELLKEKQIRIAHPFRKTLIIHSFIAVFCIGFIACSNLPIMAQSVLFIEALINAYAVSIISPKRKKYKNNEYAVVTFASHS